MVAAGAEHSVAITEDGDLYGWGWGQYGNLGLGDTNNRSIPEKVTVDHVCYCPQTYIYYNSEKPILTINIVRFPRKLACF